jgi:hypothetical protein
VPAQPAKMRNPPTVSFEKPDPVERYVPLFFKVCVYALLTVFFLQALDAFYEYRPGMRWGGLLFIFRTFTFLPLHEGGHFLFMFFGRTLYVLGGSFWQIVFPLLWFIIALRQRSQVFPFALFWVGENMMDVSLYIRDAPHRILPLLGGDKSGHDWYYLLSQWGAMDSADTMADILFYGGIIVCIGAIGTGVVLAVTSFIRSGRPAPLNASKEPASAPAVLDDVDREVRKIEGLP